MSFVLLGASLSSTRVCASDNGSQVDNNPSILVHQTSSFSFNSNRHFKPHGLTMTRTFPFFLSLRGTPSPSYRNKVKSSMRIPRSPRLFIYLSSSFCVLNLHQHPPFHFPLFPLKREKRRGKKHVPLAPHFSPSSSPRLFSSPSPPRLSFSPRLPLPLPLFSPSPSPFPSPSPPPPPPISFPFPSPFPSQPVWLQVFLRFSVSSINPSPHPPSPPSPSRTLPSFPSFCLFNFFLSFLCSIFLGKGGWILYLSGNGWD